MRNSRRLEIKDRRLFLSSLSWTPSAMILAAWAVMAGMTVSAQEAGPWMEKPVLARPFEIHEYILPNGLRVLCQPRPDSQSVVVMLCFRVGSRNENDANNGISHYLEHMLFTGTERWDENELKLFIPALGGVWNGTTTEETTKYYASLPKEHFEASAEWLDQLVFRPALPSAKIDKERAIIYQEMMGRYDTLIRILDGLGLGYDLDRRVEQAIFPGSPLSFRVIGEARSLEKIGRNTLLSYYEKHYAPGNGVFVVVGGVEPGMAARVAQRLFGSVQARAAPEKPATPVMPAGGPFEVVVRGPWETDYCRLMMGARTVGKNHPDHWPLEVLGTLLSQGLTDEVRYQRGLVYDMDCRQSSFSDAGYFFISTESERAHIPEIRRMAAEALEKIRIGNVDPAALARAKAALKGRWILSMEDNLRRATWLDEWALHGGETGVPSYADKVDAVQATDLSRAVKTYFTPATSFTGLHIPILTVKSGLYLILGISLLAAACFAWRIYRRKRRRAS